MLNRIIIFLKEVKLEIKKVNWPTRQEVIRYTLIIVGVSAVVAAFLGTLDFIFLELMREFIF